jgi:FkbM family methyltransferase
LSSAPCPRPEEYGTARRYLTIDDGDFRPILPGKRSKGLLRASALLMQSPLKHLKEQWKYLKGQESFRRSPLLTASRLIAWRVRCLLQKPATINLPEWDVRIFLPAEWRGIAKLVFAFRESYEPELSCLKTILSPGSTFIDVGANIGIYTLAASKIVGETGRVLAFEPSTQSSPLLAKNIALNGLTNVHTFSVALAQKKGRAWLHRGPNPTLNSLGKDPSWKEDGEEVVMEPLDRVLRKACVGSVDVIKMDVQGAEELVLRGASNIVTSAHPIVILEVWPEGAALLGLSPYGALELLKSWGYRFFSITGCEDLRELDQPVPSVAVQNVIAVHGRR